MVLARTTRCVKDRAHAIFQYRELTEIFVFVEQSFSLRPFLVILTILHCHDKLYSWEMFFDYFIDFIWYQIVLTFEAAEMHLYTLVSRYLWLLQTQSPRAYYSARISDASLHFGLY